MVKGSYYIAKFVAMNEMASSSHFAWPGLAPLPLFFFSHLFFFFFFQVSCQVGHQLFLVSHWFASPPSLICHPSVLVYWNSMPHFFLLKGNSFITLNHCFCFFTVDYFSSDTTTLLRAFKTLFPGWGKRLLIKPKWLLLLLVCSCLGTVKSSHYCRQKTPFCLLRECAVHVLSTRMVASVTGAVFSCYLSF